MHRLRRSLSFANVTSLLALFVALAGTSYAAVAITSGDVKNNSLTSADIRNNTIKSGDVKNRSLLARDFKAGQLPAGAQGPAGPPGPAGTVDTSRFYDSATSDARFLGKGEKAADADKLDGRDLGSVVVGSGAKESTLVTIDGCGGSPLVLYEVTLDQPSRLFVSGSTETITDAASHDVSLRVYLRDGTGVVASSPYFNATDVDPEESVTVSGLLTASGAPYTAAPGEYTLSLQGENTGACGGDVDYNNNALSHLAIPVG